ncbi:hypothetical protein QN224_06540 [Sinorhizobium sp. 8-89]|uniref:hypothetical protein n=1 Tax=Sinorhizobium sp. 7-81 TaxID=3049087 RepID=UPI0024C23AAE|nr:hypothetical protein [Sinorhizobium sp. 7-81]MDK1385063.1 hypothetical protein [Sinorhizobium sp. 7-81]
MQQFKVLQRPFARLTRRAALQEQRISRVRSPMSSLTTGTAVFFNTASEESANQTLPRETTPKQEGYNPSAITEMLAMKRLIEAKAARSRTKSVITWLLFRYCFSFVLFLFHSQARPHKRSRYSAFMVNAPAQPAWRHDYAAPDSVKEG